MNGTGTASELSQFLRSYSLANAGRPTRIGVFERTSPGVIDYWIEDGLPLSGIDVDHKGPNQSVQIILEGYTHVVRDIQSVRGNLSIDGKEDGLDLVDKTGTTTILRFENVKNEG